jgi:hypothetical protein
MAINVDQVYKTVLLIINKEQRGYLTPDEFNKLATQVQLEVLDGYFETINQQMRVPQNESEYGNRYKSVQEQLDVFKTIGTCTYNPATGTLPAFFDVPTSSGTASGTQTFATSQTESAYPLTTITQAQVEQSSVVVTLDNVVYPVANWNITGGIFNADVFTGNPIGAGQTIDITLYPNDFYKLGTVLYRDDREVEQIQRNQLAQLNMSPISKPTDYFPVCLYENRNITVYPQTINNSLQATYIRKPSDVVWNFTSDLGYYVYNPVTSINFELDVVEQTNVILQILLYAGIVIKDPQIIQAASQEIAMEEQNERT